MPQLKRAERLVLCEIKMGGVMRLDGVIISFFACIAFAACNKPAPKADAASAPAASASASKHIFSAQQQQLEQSRQLADEVQKAADAQRQQVDKMLEGEAASASK